MENEKVDQKDDQAHPHTDPQTAQDPAAAGAIKQLTDKVAVLEAAVADKEAALSEAAKTLDVQSHDYASLKTGYEDALKAYRKLAVGSNPLFTEELITGSTIAEIDASLTRAADFVGKVRSKIEEDLKSLSIPAGAPERSGPDTSGFTSREKIAEGVKKQNK